ncbi:MAG: hypothetical protein ACJAWS_002402 [Oleiphilaceae bacterium]
MKSTAGYILNEQALAVLSDIATEAHVQIQRNFKEINPVIGVSRSMRAQGIPADAMTIDCLKTGKRIILILHDDNPEVVLYQFSFKAKDPSDEFLKIQLNELTVQKLYEWVQSYFTK